MRDQVNEVIFSKLCILWSIIFLSCKFSLFARLSPTGS